LILLTPAIAYRYKIENNNKIIQICADYYKFEKLLKQNSANSTLSTADALLNYGMSSVALSEVTLDDLLKEGSAYIISHKNFINHDNLKSSIVLGASGPMRNAVLSIFQNQITFAVTNKNRALFVEKSINKRFQPEEYTILKYGNRYIFTVKTNPMVFINAPLGYDVELAEHLINKGINVMPVISLSSYGNTSYFDEYDKFINDFNINTAIIYYTESQISRNNVQILQNILNTGISLAIVESKSQTGFENLKYIFDTDGTYRYSIQRAFATSNSRLQFINKRVLFYAWLRAIVDRNIRLIVVEPLNGIHKITDNVNTANNFNIENTFEAVSLFKKYISSRNYSIGSIEVHNALSNSLNTSIFTNNKLIFAISVFIILLSGYIFFMFTRKINVRWVYAAAFLVLLSMFFIPFYEIPVAAASIFFPFAAGIAIFICNENFHYKRYKKVPIKITKIIILTALYLIINLTGAFIISANMSHIRYISGIEAFDGAIISYAVPLILIFYFYCYSPAGIEFKKSFRNFIRKRPIIYTILLSLSCAFVIYMYLARSGNNSLIPASKAELRLREFLEYVFVARPRFKEFAIGYPCLFIYITTNLYKKNELIHPLLLIGLTIGGISINNSFCHGFTSISISMLRTFNGFALGTLVSACLLLLLKFCTKVFKSND